MEVRLVKQWPGSAMFGTLLNRRSRSLAGQVDIRQLNRPPYAGRKVVLTIAPGRRADLRNTEFAQAIARQFALHEALGHGLQSASLGVEGKPGCSLGQSSVRPRPAPSDA